MIPKECKRLAEVDFPIAAVSKHSAREKSIRHGHPSTLHLWWARRPLAACRAMLLGLLLPDPCDEHCPEEFKTEARCLFASTTFVGVKPGPSDLDLRQALLQFIGDFAAWENSSQQDYLAIGRGLVQAAHPEETPLVVDPFAGGGSIPLEALRVGCDAFASDLNPVACLIQKVMLEDIPRHGPELAEEIRQVGMEFSTVVGRELAEIYPIDPDGSRPYAYIWARTVRCESPNCGAEIPLMRSMWLTKKAKQRTALRPIGLRPDGSPPVVDFEIFHPQSEDEVKAGTVSRAKATCLCCNTSLHAERVRAQLRKQRGGADVIFDTDGNRVGGARIMAISTTKGKVRHYRLPEAHDYHPIFLTADRLSKLSGIPSPDGMSVVPDETVPLMSGTFNVPIYGMNQWGDLFTTRQALTLATLADAVRHLPVGSVNRLAAMSVCRLMVGYSSLVRWLDTGSPAGMFAMQAIPMVWDFCEVWPFGEGTGSITSACERIAAVVDKLHSTRPGEVQLADARTPQLPDEACSVWFTDPPYYFAIPYADLSDFFYVWLKRMLPKSQLSRDPFDPSNPLTPKAGELCEMAHWDRKRYAHKDKDYFERGMSEAFAAGRRILAPGGIGTVVFAHKTTEGWEALLSGLVGGGWTLTASWPIATESPNRLRAIDSASLATSVHLVCRPRPEDAPVGDWADVLHELPRRVGDWMERLQAEGVRGADLVFACIGPALEVYSRYSKVETAEGYVVPLGGDPEAREPHLRGFLAYVWEIIGRSALEQVLGTAEARARNGAAGSLEEDSRLTALFLWTLQTNGNGAEEEAPDVREEANGDDGKDEEEGPASRSRPRGFSLPYDVARRFAQPLGIHLDEWEGRIIKTEKGVVRLLPVAERAKQLFGEEGAEVVAYRIETEAAATATLQLTLFPDEPPAVRGRRRRTREGAAVSDADLQAAREATTLDRIHAAMLLQVGGRTNALRALLRAEVERGSDFVRLANALSALYPMGCEEKRLLDAMLLAVPR